MRRLISIVQSGRLEYPGISTFRRGQTARRTDDRRGQSPRNSARIRQALYRVTHVDQRFAKRAQSSWVETDSHFVVALDGAAPVHLVNPAGAVNTRDLNGSQGAHARRSEHANAAVESGSNFRGAHRESLVEHAVNDRDDRTRGNPAEVTPANGRPVIRLQNLARCAERERR